MAPARLTVAMQKAQVLLDSLDHPVSQLRFKRPLSSMSTVQAQGSLPFLTGSLVLTWDKAVGRVSQVLVTGQAGTHEATDLQAAALLPACDRGWNTRP